MECASRTVGGRGRLRTNRDSTRRKQKQNCCRGAVTYVSSINKRIAVVWSAMGCTPRAVTVPVVLAFPTRFRRHQKASNRHSYRGTCINIRYTCRTHTLMYLRWTPDLYPTPQKPRQRRTEWRRCVGKSLIISTRKMVWAAITSHPLHPLSTIMPPIFMWNPCSFSRDHLRSLSHCRIWTSVIARKQLKLYFGG